MNPSPEEANKDTTSTPSQEPSEFGVNAITQELPSEADQAALQAIAALEAESSTINASPADEDVIQESALPTPTTPFQETAVAGKEEPVVASFAAPAVESKKKPSKKIGLIIGMLALLIGAAVATYLILDFMSPDQITKNDTLQSSSVTQQSSDDTEESVKGAAASLSGTTESLDDTMLEDSSLSDDTLYQNAL